MATIAKWTKGQEEEAAEAARIGHPWQVHDVSWEECYRCRRCGRGAPSLRDLRGACLLGRSPGTEQAPSGQGGAQGPGPSEPGSSAAPRQQTLSDLWVAAWAQGQAAAEIVLLDDEFEVA